jgi:hypothetical protein
LLSYFASSSARRYSCDLPVFYQLRILEAHDLTLHPRPRIVP